MDNESIVAKTEKQEGIGEGEDLEDEVHDTKHPLLLNQYPVSAYHSLMLMFAEEGLPQVLSDELTLLLFSLFKLSSNTSLKIGYNSMGADCITNNLHVHLLYADSIFSHVNQPPVFPIEAMPKRLFFGTSLQHKNSAELNMYSVGVRFGEVLDWPLKAIVISPEIDETKQQTLEDAQESLAHAAGSVFNLLIDQNLPHNVLLAD